MVKLYLKNKKRKQENNKYKASVAPAFHRRTTWIGQGQQEDRPPGHGNSDPNPYIQDVRAGRWLQVHDYQVTKSVPENYWDAVFNDPFLWVIFFKGVATGKLPIFP